MPRTTRGIRSMHAPERAKDGSLLIFRCVLFTAHGESVLANFPSTILVRRWLFIPLPTSYLACIHTSLQRLHPKGHMEDFAELELEMERQQNSALVAELERERGASEKLQLLLAGAQERASTLSEELARSNALVESLRVEVSRLRGGVHSEHFKSVEARAVAAEEALAAGTARHAAALDKWADTRTLLKGVVETLSREKEGLVESVRVEWARANANLEAKSAAEVRAAGVEVALANARVELAMVRGELDKMKGATPAGVAATFSVAAAAAAASAVAATPVTPVAAVAAVSSSSGPSDPAPAVEQEPGEGGDGASEGVGSGGGGGRGDALLPGSGSKVAGGEVGSTTGSPSLGVVPTPTPLYKAPSLSTLSLPIEEVARRAAEDLRNRAAAFRIKAGISQH